MQVKDVKVVSGAVLVRLKGIKQDPRMQRPEAAGNEDWIVIGDVPGSDFSIMFWVQLLFGFHHGARDQDAPFFCGQAARWTVSSRLGFIPNTHWQLGRMMDVPFGGTISRYGLTGFFCRRTA